MNTLETYILKLIEKRKKQLDELQKQKSDYSEKDYWALFHRYSGAINDLYLCLTAHDNTYDQQNAKTLK